MGGLSHNLRALSLQSRLGDELPALAAEMQSLVSGGRRSAV
jgi:hypothetical protein